MSAEEHLIKPGENMAEERRAARRGRQKGLGARVRRMVGEDGDMLVELWMSIAMDPLRKDADRIRCSELLADRGWGKSAGFVLQEGDPLGLEDVKAAAEEFRGKLLRLAPEAGAREEDQAGG